MKPPWDPPRDVCAVIGLGLVPPQSHLPAPLAADTTPWWFVSGVCGCARTGGLVQADNALILVQEHGSISTVLCAFLWIMIQGACYVHASCE